MQRILLAEDDPQIASIIASGLEETGDYRVLQASCAKEALLAAADGFDLALLDIMLPDMDGIALCESLRGQWSAPILFITCIEDDETVVRALEAGGDDYIVKPFSSKVLLARVRSNLRRMQLGKVQSAKDVWTFAGCTFCFSAQTLANGASSFKLSNMESRILLFFLQHPAQYFSAGELYEQIWEKPSFGDIRTVQVHIHNLRAKIEPDSVHPQHILSEWGKGYRFEPSPGQAP